MTSPWTRQNVDFSIGNKLQQFWDLEEIDESMNAPKFEYFLGNIKGYENRSDQPKIRNSKKAYFYLCFFQEKSMTMLQDKN